jgi:acyl-CoA thioester hydrolase
LTAIEFDQPIYTYNIDAGRHVSNIVYIQWMEIGRNKLLEAVGLPAHSIHKEGFIPIITHTEITYRLPLFLGDLPRIVLQILELRRISAILSFQFFNQKGELVAKGLQTAAFLRLSDNKIYRLPDEYRARFEAYLYETPPAG